MRFLHQALAGALAFGLVSTASPALAFPDGPIEFVIPFGAGGGADIEGRLLAKEMSNILGVPLVPVNKPGGGGAITYTYITNAKPDGHTIAWNSTSVLTTTNLGNTEFEYDAMDHIGRVEFQPQPFAVKGDSKWNSFADFVSPCFGLAQLFSGDHLVRIPRHLALHLPSPSEQKRCDAQHLAEMLVAFDQWHIFSLDEHHGLLRWSALLQDVIIFFLQFHHLGWPLLMRLLQVGWAFQPQWVLYQLLHCRSATA